MSRRLAFWLLAALLIGVALVGFIVLLSPKRSTQGSNEKNDSMSHSPESHHQAGKGASNDNIIRAAPDTQKVIFGGQLPSFTGTQSTRRRGLADYMNQRDLEKTIAQLNTSADPADWHLSVTLNTWCATIGSIDSNTAEGLRDLIGVSNAERTLSKIDFFRHSCAGAGERALSAPNLRFGDLQTLQYDWKQARTVSTLALAEPGEAKAALIAIGANPDLMASWLHMSSFSLLPAPFLADVPSAYRPHVVALAVCEANPDVCAKDGLHAVATCFSSMGSWCGQDSLSNNILLSLPESARLRISAKAAETVDAIRNGKVDRFVVRK